MSTQNFVLKRIGIFDDDAVDVERWNLVLMLFPALFTFVFMIGSLLFVFVVSFMRVEQYELIRTFTLQNYIEIFTQGTFGFFIIKSLIMALSVTVTSLVVGYPVAYYLSRKVSGTRQLLVLLLIAAPFFVGTLVRVFAHQALVGPTGIINLTFAEVGLGTFEFLAYNNFQTFIGKIYLWLPFMIISVFLSLENIDFNLLEAAKDSGASPLRAFYEITWPLSRPGVVIGSILVFTPSFSGDIVSAFVGGPDGTLIGNVLHGLFGESGQWALAGALSIMIILIVAVLIIGLVKTIPWSVYTKGRGGT